MSGHYDEITKIQRLRNDQLNQIRNHVQRARDDRPQFDQTSRSQSNQTLRKTTARKSPSGHH